MKKRFSALTVGIIAFLMLATGVAAGEVFDRWLGEEHTKNTIENLDAINSGINRLKTDLENKEQDLLDKQAELDEAIADSKTDKDKIVSLEGDIVSLEGDIASLEGRLENSLEGVTLEELKTLTSNTNSESGLRHKYDTLKDGINKYLKSQEDVVSTDKLNEHNGKEAEDNQLQEALNDVQNLEKKSGEVLSNLQGTNE